MGCNASSPLFITTISMTTMMTEYPSQGMPHGVHAAKSYNTSNSISKILNFDMIVKIIEYSDVTTFFNVSLTSKALLACISMCEGALEVENSRKIQYVRGSSNWAINRIHRLNRFKFHFSNIDSTFLKDVIQNKVSASPHQLLNVSVSKCFGVAQGSLRLAEHCEQLAFCDILYTQIPSKIDFSNLKALVLTNSTFPEGIDVLQNLWSNIPEQLNLLALGGLIGLSRSRSLAPEPTNTEKCMRMDIIIESTFLSVEDKLFLGKIFPLGKHVDLILDEVSEIRCLNSFPFLTPAIVCCSRASLETPLHLSSRKLDIERIHWLLAAGARVLAKDCKGNTALHRAIDASRFIHKPKQDILEFRTVDSSTAETDTLNDYEISNMEGSKKMKSSLLTLDDDVRLQLKSSDCCELLLKFGSDCFLKNQNNETPLYIACIKGNHYAVKCILDHIWKSKNGNVLGYFEAIRGVADHKGYSLLHAAVIGRSSECCRLLLTPPCINMNLMSKKLYTSDIDEDILSRIVDYVNKPTISGGVCPLHLGYRYAAHDIISLLMNCGADRTAVDNFGNSVQDYSSLNSKTKSSFKHSRRSKVR